MPANQPVATRPLAIQINGTWYTYGWDLTKNICEMYSSSGAISTSYTYTPFGQVTASGAITQPIQWSSEMWDSELGFVYYNWRYYNAWHGSWCVCDTIFDKNLYIFTQNSPINVYDFLGKWGCQQRPKDTCNPDYNPDFWNSPKHVSTNNCYRYALNMPNVDENQTSDPGFSSRPDALLQFIEANSTFKEVMNKVRNSTIKGDKINVSVNPSSYCSEIKNLRQTKA